MFPRDGPVVTSRRLIFASKGGMRNAMVRRVSIAVGLFALAVAAPALAGVKAAVGVCVRWGPSPDHVQDAVVVVPSGNPVLDAAVPDSIRQMQWKAPKAAAGARGWVGIWMSVDGAPIPPGPLPSCDKADDILARSQRPTHAT